MIPMNRESLSFTAEGSQLPDIAGESAQKIDFESIDWVGMSEVEVPITLMDSEGETYRTAAFAGCFVSLDNRDSRGIHMSRLFKQAQSELAQKVLKFSVLEEILQQFLSSHQGLSNRAKIEVKFNALVQRKALVSDNLGWRNYPTKIFAIKQSGHATRFFAELVVTYSSTCPASAALARQLIQENFKEKFISRDLVFKDIYQFLGSSEGIIATPHAQRSEARIKIELSGQEDNLVKYIDLVEDVLATPVQTLVKREDEQEFAFRNGQNLMFCEDAARKIHGTLDKQKDVIDFVVQVSHFESLHPHNAVSIISKNKELRGFE